MNIHRSIIKNQIHCMHRKTAKKNAMFCNISGHLPSKAVGLFSEVAMYMAEADGEQRMFSEVVMYM